jgi:CheY-like chemotaxis protein
VGRGGFEMGKHALVADDEHHVVDVVKSMLARRDFRVTVASDGIEALAKIREDPPDILLLDIMMPKMDGATLAQKLRESPETAPIPIVFLTGLVGVEEPQRRGARFGGQLYLAKPFDADQLFEVIELALAAP